MGEFVAITTQEEFDARIGERLKRERETVTGNLKKEYEGWLSPEAHKKALDEASEKLTASKTEAEGLKAQVKRYEADSVKTRIAHELGLPYEMASRLTGEDEAAIRKDGEVLAQVLGNQRRNGAPPADPEGGAASGADAAYRSLLENL